MFESLVLAYQSMDTSAKKKALINEITKSISILKRICNEKSIRYREIDIDDLDTFSNDEVIDAYLEKMFVYIMYLEELTWSYVEYTDKN